MLNFNSREVEAESWVDTIESDFAVVDIKTLKQTCEATCMNKHLLTGKSFCFIVGSDSPPFGTLENNTKDLNMLTVWCTDDRI